MKILFEKELLLKSISILQRAAQTKVNSNIPGAIYIRTINNAVEMQANDFDLGIQLSINADIYEEGEVVIASKFLQDIIRRMPENTISLSKIPDTQTVLIQSGAVEYKLITYSLSDFKIVEPIYKEQSIKLDTKEFKELIDLTIYAVSNDESRPIFTGAYMQIKDNNICMVGTDTHRLAVKKIVHENNLDSMEAIIPSRILMELSKLLPIENPQMVEIIWNKSQIAFIYENVYIATRLVEGKFPDYEKIIPTQFIAKASLQRKELMQAVERVSLLSKDMSYNAIKFEWNENYVLLSSQNVEFGSARDQIRCDFKGTPFVISFNGRYITDILKHGNGEWVHLHLTDRGPMVIRDDENVNYTYVVTPIRSN